MTGRRKGNRERPRDHVPQVDAAGDEVREAADIVKQAQAALERAERALQASRSRAAEIAAQSRAGTIGDLIDVTRTLVRRYPLTGLTLAGIMGILFGRSTRR